MIDFDTNTQGDLGDLRVAEAETILKSLRGIPPQYATSETVAKYKRAASLVSDFLGSPLWFETQAGLGIHLIESAHGDRSDNIELAKSVFREILEFASQSSSTNAWAWELAVSEIATLLWNHPSATQSDYDESSSLYESLIVYQKEKGDIQGLVRTIGNCAQMHSRWTVGDVDAHLERAIQMQEEAIQYLVQISEATQEQFGRAHYILAALYLNRRTGVRSQNVDRAIHSLRISLDNRPVDQDSLGRVRTLRALAIAYPEWSGADSLAHAQQLSASAETEAAQIEQNDSRVATVYRGWKGVSRQKSALMLDLDKLLYEDLPPEERSTWLGSVIENHQEALRNIPRDTMPVQWAEWMGGLARLLGRYPSLGVWNHLEEAYNCFDQALSAINPSEYPRLYRELLRRFGELCHEIGDFNGSLRTYGTASDISDVLFDAFADPEHQWIELEQNRGFALFAAYAAARVGQPEVAVRFAEQQRTRSLKDMLDSRRILTMVSEDRRNEIREVVKHIQQLEDSLRQLNQQDPDAQIATIQGRLADYGGVDPSIIQIRRTDDAAYTANPIATERNRLRSELADARSGLQALLMPEETGDKDNSYSQSLGSPEIATIARMINRALIYLIATVHGGMAIIVLPEGAFDMLPLENMTSDMTKKLLAGNEEVSGFLNSSILEDSNDFQKSLNEIRNSLGSAVMEPLTSWLKSRGVMRAVLIPLGLVGLLPIHIAGEDNVVFSYAPSARALMLSSAKQTCEIIDRTLVVANPSWENENPLPFAVAEARAVSNLMNTKTRLVNTEKFVLTRVAPDATFAQVCEGTRDTSCIHFACHGIFRPSEPLASHLLLASDDHLYLADIFSGHMDFSGTRLITLSACQSGNVEFRRTPDESIGFPSALMLAGVPSIVSTLWKVDDAAAMFFTMRFYELVIRENLEPIDAVAHAQVWLKQVNVDELKSYVLSIRDTLEPADEETDAALSTLWRGLMYDPPLNPPYASPKFWGAFILTGM